MNRKGQVNVGLIIIVSIALIVGALLFRVVAQEVGLSTNLATINRTISSASAGDQYNFTDLRSLGSVTATNATDGAAILSGNYTTASNQVINGALVATLTLNASSEMDTFDWFVVSTTAQPTGYVDNAGARAVSTLIVIFFALAVAVVALEPTLRSRVLEAMGR